MDPEKPKSDSKDERPSDGPSAEQRAEQLSGRDRVQEGGRGLDAPRDRDAASGRETGSGEAGRSAGPGRDEAGTSADSGGSAGSGRPGAGSAKVPPRLTERQRKEAREQRRRAGRSRSRKSTGGRTGAARTRARDGSTPGNPLSRGIRATLVELRRTAGFFGALILTGLDRLGPAVRWLVAGLLALLSAAGTALSALGNLLARAASRLGRALVALDRHVTPRRALIGVVGAGIAALIASQFLDFRATEVGQAAYDPIQDITRAPRLDIQTPMDSHSILLLVVGAMALAGLAGSAITGRRAFGGLIALAGAATIAVALLIDLPKGLDVAVAEISYSGVDAVLLPGFWAQLAAGFVLTTGGLGLLALSGQRSRIEDRSDGREPDGSSQDRDRRRDDRRSGSRREEGLRQGGGQESRPINAGGMP
jgi:hypothetical protein